jgi:hypothetical protein
MKETTENEYTQGIIFGLDKALRIIEEELHEDESRLVAELNSLINRWEETEAYARTASKVLDDELYVMQAETLKVCAEEVRNLLK